jgi:hypothetical protein
LQYVRGLIAAAASGKIETVAPPAKNDIKNGQKYIKIGKFYLLEVTYQV